MAKGRRMDSEINAGSMADIAFLLLVFFLVTTTMDTDFGLARRLPPPLPADMPKPPEVKQRNVFVILVNRNDQLLVEGEPLDILQLKNKTKEFLTNPTNSDDLPEKIKVTSALANQKIAQFGSAGAAGETALKKWRKKLDTQQLVGDYWDLPKSVISLKNDRGTSYDMYIQVQNELASAYNELRDELALKMFDETYSELYSKGKDGSASAKAKAKAIKTVFPQRISEAEPENTK